jgi:hypothetical protein
VVDNICRNDRNELRSATLSRTDGETNNPSANVLRHSKLRVRRAGLYPLRANRDNG